MSSAASRASRDTHEVRVAHVISTNTEIVAYSTSTFQYTPVP